MNWIASCIMGIYGLYMKIFSIPAESNEEIHYDLVINAMEPWMLACAVGAWNGTMRTSSSKPWFEDWFRMSKKNWLPEIKKKTNLREKVIFRVLRLYAMNNSFKDLQTVYEEEELKRGREPDTLLMPGESVTLEIHINRVHKR